MGDPETSSLDWQLRCEKTQDRLSHVFHNKLWTDCTFLVGDDEPETISAHKFVLAMSSPVFDTMFNGSMPESESPIRIPDVQPNAFKLMLEFVYTENAQLSSCQEASGVYCAAKKYMLPYIMRRCVQYMEWNLTATSACFAHEFATLFDEETLLKAAVKKFKRKTKEILKGGSFYEAPIGTVVALFSQNELDIDTELDLFNALERYSSEAMGLKNLKRFCNRQPVKSPSKRPKVKDQEYEVSNEGESLETSLVEEPTEDEKRLIAEIRLALAHIRFLTLSAQTFTAAAYSILLHEEEALAIMMNLAGAPVPLPPGISDSKRHRDLTAWPPDYEGTHASTSTPYKIDYVFKIPQGVPGPSLAVASSKVRVHEVMCTFSVKGFMSRKHSVVSEAFYTDDLKWHVNCVLGVEHDPETDTNEKIVGVLVECSHPAASWACSAVVTLRLLGLYRPTLGYHVPTLCRTFSNVYHPKSTIHGFDKIAPFSTVQKFVRSNMLTINTRIVASITKL